ncbi:helix-turn-helix transcriptional regulator [Actinokineospora pegani]|uniref:helix-turn-helix transcriptional regulator n=1 Tax=Actinokineospora pegani TaxID=2654637 RepID=UPI0012EA23E9|nr:LuxR family transcriptional regulator [Actinokineospora pegani]
MSLVERHDEFSALTRLYAEAARGRGQVALISGGVASGKTELLHTFAEHVAGAGAVLLAATGSRAERTLRFGVVRQLAQSPDIPGTLGEQATRMLRVREAADAEGGGDPSALGRESARMLDTLCATLLDVAKQAPVVIAVDDVQFADPASLQSLLYLQRRIRFGRVLVVLTEWALPRPTQAVFRAEVTRQPNTCHLRLAPLSPAGVAELLAQRFDQATAAALAPVHHAVSGGNPLLVTALAEDHRAAGRRAGESDVVVGPEFAAGVLACLHRWEPGMLDVARGLALLGGTGTPVVLASLLEMTSDCAAQALDVLEMAGLLDAGRFRHPVAKAAVLDSMAPAERGELHLRAARLCFRDGAQAVEVAAHLTAAADLDTRVSGQWAVAVLRNAAQEDIVADRVDLAVHRLELAAAITDEPDEHADLTTELLRVEWRRNPSAAARHLTPLRAAMAEGGLSPRNRLHLAKFLLWYGHTDELAEALSALSGAPDSPATGQAGLALHWLEFLHPPVVTAVPAPRQSGVITDPWTRVAAMLDRVRSGAPRSETITAAEQVLQSCRLGEQTLGSQLSALVTLILADRTDRAAHWCDALLVDATERGADTWLAVLGALRAEVSLRQGDLAAAAEGARGAVERLSPQGWGVAIGVPLAVHVAAATAMGAHDRAAGLLRTPVPEAMFQTQFGLRYLAARAEHYLATGRAHAALADHQRCGALMARWDLDLPALVPWRSGAAAAHLALGNRDAARVLMAEQMSRPGADGPRTRGISLRVLAAAATTERRIPLLDESVESLHTGGDRYELARSLLALSHAHNTTGDTERARTVARRAAQLAKGCQADPLTRELIPGREAEVPEQTTERRPDTTAALDILSDAERRVAVLAALGHTNREIGGKLYITVSTVEQHLTRVYRKLNVSRRTDLPAGLPQQLLAAAAAEDN